jgi:hypothetical protein
MPPITNFRLSGVSIREAVFDGRQAVELRMPSSATQDPTKDSLVDRDFMAWIDTDFGDGSIEVDVASTLEAGAPGYAPGFIGVTYRICEGSFESVYLRPRMDGRMTSFAATEQFSMWPTPTSHSRACGAQSRVSTRPTPTYKWSDGSTCVSTCRARRPAFTWTRRLKLHLW